MKNSIVKLNYFFVLVAVISMVSCERKAREVDLAPPCKTGETRSKAGECQSSSNADGNFGSGRQRSPSGDFEKSPEDSEPTDGARKPESRGTPDSSQRNPNDRGDDNSNNNPSNNPSENRDGNRNIGGNNNQSVPQPPLELDELSKKANLEVGMTETGSINLNFKSKNSDKFKDMKFSLKTLKELPALTEKFAVKGSENIMGQLESSVVLSFSFEDQKCTGEAPLSFTAPKPVALNCKK